MNFKEMKLVGFKSWGHPGIVIKLDRNGVHQIAGDNGTGKTNLVEGFYWILTGKQLKGLKVNKVINWHEPKKGAFGSLTFSISNNNYEINRFRGHPKHQNALIIYKNGVSLDLDDDPQIELNRIIELTSEELLASIVFSAENFKNVIEMPIDNRRKFMEHMFGVDRFDKASEAAVEKRRAAKREIVKLEMDLHRHETNLTDETSKASMIEKRMDDWAINNNTTATGIQTEITTIQSIDFDGIENIHIQKGLQQKIVDQANVMSDQHKVICDERVKNFNKMPKPIDEENIIFYNDNWLMHDNLSSNLTMKNKDLLNIRNAISNMKDVLSKLVDNNNSLDLKQSKLAQLEGNLLNKMTSLKKNVTDQLNLDSSLKLQMDKILQSMCPFCDQKLPEDKIKDEKEKLGIRISDCKKMLYDLSEDVTSAQQNIYKLNAEKAGTSSAKGLAVKELHEETIELKAIKSLETGHVNDAKNITKKIDNIYLILSKPGLPKREELSRQSEIQVEYNVALKDIKTIKVDWDKAIDNAKSELDKLNTLVPDYTREELATKQESLKGLIEALSKNKTSLNPFNIQLVDLNDRITTINNLIKVTKTDLGDERESLSYYEHLVLGFSRDMRVATLRQMVPSFNRFVFDYLSFLLPHAQLTFNEELDCKLIFEGKDIENPKQLNKGSRARINLSVALATFAVIRQTRSHVASNLAFYDEVLDMGLDADGERAALELLRSMSQTIFVISHSARLAEEFDSALRINRATSQNSVLQEML